MKPITKEMLTYKKPGTGISPSDVDKIVGKIAAVDIANDTILNYSMFE